jgi:inositol-hexakisphosphate kinase
LARRTAHAEQPLLIALEDLTFRFRRPCVLDLKLGRSSAGEDASEHKRADMHAKDAATTSHSLGLRICGMHVFDPRLAAHRSRSKAWGKRLTDDSFRAGLHCYFNVALFDDDADATRTQPNERICTIIRHFIVRLDAIADLMRAQSRYRFYSSSLLFVYEGDVSDADDLHDAEVSLSMIDMAHVFPLNADDALGDNGYVDALATLRAHLLANF